MYVRRYDIARNLSDCSWLFLAVRLRLDGVLMRVPDCNASTDISMEVEG